MKNFYEVLGLSKAAGHKEIKASYRALVKKYHPDIAVGNPDPKLFEEITAAYNTLVHPEKRAQYDKTLAAKKNAPGPAQSLSFRFREFKDWVFSLSFVRMFFTGKRVSKETKTADRDIRELPIDELVKRVIFSRNIYVQINAVRAIFARGDSGATRDLLRLLYSGIDESVKVEILNGLKASAEPRVQDVIRDVYDMEKSLKMKNLIRSYLKA
jgi:curved DNA-binding protein CbpA